MSDVLKQHEERGRNFARALFSLDVEKAKALVSSLENETRYGYIVNTAARWRDPRARSTVAKIYLRKDGFVVDSFSEEEMFPGGFLSPTAHAAAVYLKSCRDEGREP